MSLVIETNIFIKEILYLLDQGASLPISEFESAYDSGNIIAYVEERYGIQNENFSCGYNELKTLFGSGERPYVSTTDANDKGYKNNGLIYLVDILVDLMGRENSQIVEEIE